MNLTDVMSAMNLAIWPQISLAIFAAVFVLIVLYALTRRQEEAARCSRMALDETEDTRGVRS